METLVAEDTTEIHDACETVFRVRETHPWPPSFDHVPAHWAEPFARQATELAHTRWWDLGQRIARGSPHPCRPPQGRHDFIGAQPSSRQHRHASMSKRVRLWKTTGLQARVDVCNLFNTVNFCGGR